MDFKVIRRTRLLSSCSKIPYQNHMMNHVSAHAARVIALPNGGFHEITDEIVNGIVDSGCCSMQGLRSQALRALIHTYGSCILIFDGCSEAAVTRGVDISGPLTQLHMPELYVLDALKRGIKTCEMFIVAERLGNYQTIHSLIRTLIDCLALISSLEKVVDTKEHINSFLRFGKITSCEQTKGAAITKKGNYPKFDVSGLVKEYDPIDNSIKEWFHRAYQESCKFAHHTPVGLVDLIKLDQNNMTLDISLDGEYISSDTPILPISRFDDLLREIALYVHRHLIGGRPDGLFNGELSIRGYRAGYRRLQTLLGRHLMPRIGRDMRFLHIKSLVHEGVVVRTFWRNQFIPCPINWSEVRGPDVLTNP